MPTSGQTGSPTQRSSVPSRRRVERLARRKGYRLEKLGSYTIPAEVLTMTENLILIEAAIALMEKTTHDDYDEELRWQTLSRLKTLRTNLQQRRRIYLQ